MVDRASNLEGYAAEYFIEEVRRRIYDRFGEEKLYRGGLSIRTTVNTRFQKTAKKALRDGLSSYDRRQGFRGPVTRLEDLTDWGTQLTEIDIPSDLAPWRLAVILEVGKAAAKIGLRPYFTRAGQFADETQTAKMDLEAVEWARARKEATKKDDKVLGPPIKRIKDVLAVGDVVWVSPSARKIKTRRGADRDPNLAAHYYTLEQYPEANGALVAMDPHNGRVLAMIGGYSFSTSEFNRATQANRQPGSAFKPFVYAAALDKGFTPTTLVLDAPFVMDQGDDHGFWKPENYSRRFYGLSTVRLGMELSRNLMTIRMAQEIGMPIISEYARRFDINRSLRRGLAMSLGAGETTLLRLTTAYAMLVNGGKRIQPVFIDRVQDRFGTTLQRHDKRNCAGCVADKWAGQAPPELADEREEILSAQTSYQIVSMLEGAVKRGTGGRVRSLGKTLAGKTGTTNNSRDAWFVGFSADLVVGVYVGHDDNKPLGEGETGSRVALPVFKQFMQHALKGQTTPPFRIPPGLTLVRINAKTGELAKPGDEVVILESFKPGTEPGGVNDQAKERSVLHETQTIGTGTGGLY